LSVLTLVERFGADKTGIFSRRREKILAGEGVP
jgi:hypothetical protein